MLGAIAHRDGDLDEAVRRFTALTRLQPGQAEPLANLGMAQMAMGRAAEAVDSFGRAARLAPGAADLHAHLGNALAACRRLDEAESAFAAALARQSRHLGALTGLGVCLARQDRAADAIAAFERALAVDPNFAPALTNLGLVHAAQGALDRAGQCHEAALRLQPRYPEALTNLGAVRTRQNRNAEAIDLHQAALALRPDFVEALINLGDALRAAGRNDDAIAAYDRARNLGAAPSLGHGTVLMEAGRWDEAIAELETMAGAGLADETARTALALSFLAMGRQGEAAANLEAVLAEFPQSRDAHRAMLGLAVNRDDLDADQLRVLHQRFAAAHAPAEPAERPDFSALAAAGRLKIGYLSSDLRAHSVAKNLLPVIRNHDRAGFALHFYALSSEADAITDRFKAAADGWHDVAALSDDEIAAQIRADGIHILVCLAGRFDANRPSLLARRSAPVQISLHDVATSAMPEADYIIGDSWLLPRRGGEYFSERRLRLPQFYIVDFPEALPPLPAVPRSGPVVFACFNAPSKINDSVLRLWGEILAARPEARLVLKYQQHYRSDDLRRRMRDRLVAAGAKAGQIDFIDQRDGEGQFLRRYDDVDIALDTFPFSGSTTTFQALAMGVPVVTWAKDRMVSRWSAAMLAALGLESLIATSAEGYVACALAAADAVDAWRGRRDDIRDALAASALCDGKGFTRHLERLYRAVWRRFRATLTAPSR